MERTYWRRGWGGVCVGWWVGGGLLCGIARHPHQTLRGCQGSLLRSRLQGRRWGLLCGVALLRPRHWHHTLREGVTTRTSVVESDAVVGLWTSVPTSSGMYVTSQAVQVQKAPSTRSAVGLRPVEAESPPLDIGIKLSGVVRGRCSGADSRGIVEGSSVASLYFNLDIGIILLGRGVTTRTSVVESDAVVGLWTSVPTSSGMYVTSRAVQVQKAPSTLALLWGWGLWRQSPLHSPLLLGWLSRRHLHQETAIGLRTMCHHRWGRRCCGPRQLTRRGRQGSLLWSGPTAIGGGGAGWGSWGWGILCGIAQHWHQTQGLLLRSRLHGRRWGLLCGIALLWPQHWHQTQGGGVTTRTSVVESDATHPPPPSPTHPPAGLSGFDFVVFCRTGPASEQWEVGAWPQPPSSWAPWSMMSRPSSSCVSKPQKPPRTAGWHPSSSVRRCSSY